MDEYRSHFGTPHKDIDKLYVILRRDELTKSILHHNAVYDHENYARIHSQVPLDTVEALSPSRARRIEILSKAAIKSAEASLAFYNVYQDICNIKQFIR